MLSLLKKIGGLIMAPCGSPFPPTFSSTVKKSEISYASQAFIILNQYRRQQGLRDIFWDEQAAASCVAWALHMAQGAGLVHSGVPVNECIAYGYKTPAEAIQGWVDDPPHRVILFSEIAQKGGIGTALDANWNPYWCFRSM